MSHVVDEYSQVQPGRRALVTVMCAATAAVAYCASWILLGVLHDLVRTVHAHQAVRRGDRILDCGGRRRWHRSRIAAPRARNGYW